MTSKSELAYRALDAGDAPRVLALVPEDDPDLLHPLCEPVPLQSGHFVHLSEDGGMFTTHAGATSIGVWTIDARWFFLEDVLAEAEASVHDGAASRWVPSLAGGHGATIDVLLDLWRDLHRLASRPGVAPADLARVTRLRSAIVAQLVDRLPDGEGLADPLVRIDLVDRTLADEVAQHLQR